MQSLLFLPDISGFTKFIHETEIEHSQHIIQGLLEVLLNTNKIDLIVSEIEGDAIFFYRPGKPPSFEEILEQIKKMFLGFHLYIKELENDRVCDCGACSTAINLSLKFIVHFGEVSLSKIKEHTKLLGSDVIIAHRLLKNNLNEQEYVLFSAQYIQFAGETESAERTDWVKKLVGSVSYEHIGEINYTYILLSGLKSEIPKITPEYQARRYKRPILVEHEISAPMRLIYNTIIDLSLRLNWTDGLRDIKYNKGEIPRVGVKHICALPFGNVEIETVERRFKKGVIEYAERATNMKIVHNATTFYILKDTTAGTIVSVEFHYEPLPVLGRVIDLFLRPIMKKSLRRSLLNLKHFCEHRLSDGLKEQTR